MVYKTIENYIFIEELIFGKNYEKANFSLSLLKSEKITFFTFTFEK